MEDRVADVLAERAALDHGAAAGVIVSVLLHGTATALVIYAAMHQPPTKTASLINIRLASQPASAPMPAPEKAPRIEPPKPQPVKPALSTKPPEKNTVPLSPFGRSSKKGSETPEPPKPPTTDNRQPTTPPVPIGGTGVTGIEGDFPYTLYIERMRTLIGSRWFRPQITTGAATTIYFFINRDGSIRDAMVEMPSGNPTFDRAALRAVLEASPLPPLPFGYGGTYLGVHLSFR